MNFPIEIIYAKLLEAEKIGTRKFSNLNNGKILRNRIDIIYSVKPRYFFFIKTWKALTSFLKDEKITKKLSSLFMREQVFL